MLLTSSLPSPTFASPVHFSTSTEAALTLLGPSPAMSQLWSQVRRLAPHVRSLLLVGKPDCGQDAVAHLLLDLSPQAHRMFVALTAAEAETRLLRPAGLASIPTDILLYLPDVDRLSSPAQEALLRLIRSRRSRPFTVIAAATEDLRGAVGLGRFLPELAEVLGAARLHLPSLEDRREDLPMLITQLLTQHCRAAGCDLPEVSEGFLRTAMQYGWPGNLRELAQVLSAVCRQADGPLVAEHLLGALSPAPGAARAEAEAARLIALDTVVQEHIGAVLRACRGNKQRAAEILGISRSTLYRMLDAAATNCPAPLHSC